MSEDNPVVNPPAQPAKKNYRPWIISVILLLTVLVTSLAAVLALTAKVEPPQVVQLPVSPVEIPVAPPYFKDTILAAGSFFGVNGRYYRNDQVISFNDMLSEPGRPVVRVDFVSGYRLEFNCSIDEFAEIMDKTSR